MTEFSWLGLHIAEHWRGLFEIAAAVIACAAFGVSWRSGVSRR